MSRHKEANIILYHGHNTDVICHDYQYINLHNQHRPFVYSYTEAIHIRN